MSSSLQTILALGIVLTALVLLVRSSLKKRQSPGCASEACGAISPEVKRLQAKLRR